MPPNLVNFGPETVENGWLFFAHPLNFRFAVHLVGIITRAIIPVHLDPIRKTKALNIGDFQMGIPQGDVFPSSFWR